MEFYLDILILVVRVLVFFALMGFVIRHFGRRDEGLPRTVRHLMLALVLSDALLYANLIYGKGATLLNVSIHDVPNLLGIFGINIVAGALALTALLGIRRIDKYGQSVL